MARYIKDYYWWFPLHIILQATGVLLSIVGFGLAVAMTEGSHFSTLHSWFGLVTLCLSVVAPALGVAADMTYEPTRDSPPWWPDIFHCKDLALWCRTIRICVSVIVVLLLLLISFFSRVEWSFHCDSCLRYYHFGYETIWSTCDISASLWWISCLLHGDLCFYSSVSLEKCTSRNWRTWFLAQGSSS